MNSVAASREFGFDGHPALANVERVIKALTQRVNPPVDLAVQRIYSRVDRFQARINLGAQAVDTGDHFIAKRGKVFAHAPVELLHLTAQTSNLACKLLETRGKRSLDKSLDRAAGT
jgi:hypothetical protein